MVKRTITFCMACFILLGSAVFPLGDFSLTRDLPDMYRSYSKLATSDEVGVLDFIGDYLLHGKDIFGHNANDKPQNASNNVQFQHQPVPFFFLLTTLYRDPVSLPQDMISHPPICLNVNTFDFKNKLFRPPLA